MATPTRATRSAGRPSGQQTPAPKPPVAAPVSSSVQTATRSGAPAVTLAPVTNVGAKLAADEVDLSTGELVIPEPVAASIEDSKELELKTRLPGLAEGTIKVRKAKAGFRTTAPQAILLRHPALASFAATHPTVLVLDIKDNKIGGWVGLGQPGPAKGNKRALIDGMAKGAELLGWAGLSKLTFPTYRNQFEAGVIDVAVENLGFTLGGFLAGTGNAALDNTALSFDGSAKINIPGGSGGELAIRRDPTGALSGRLDILVQVGNVGGTVRAVFTQGFVSIMGSVAYSSDRLSGKVTLVATDEPTARNVTLLKPSGGEVPIELPGPDKPQKPGKRAFAGWGTLTFRVTDWLAGAATVLINSEGQATIVGEIVPPKEFVLFDQKEWIKNILTLEIKAGYGIPVVGQVGVYASILLDAIAKIGPGKLYNIKLSGAYSTDPRVSKSLTIEGSLNISAFAGLRLRAEAGIFFTILGHDIKVGAGFNAIAGVRGYVEATPRIGMRELAPGQRQYFIQGHLEIAAQPVLGFSGDLFVKIETPWWSPLSDKTWTWPLFSLEYPLPGEFGIGADVDYVLGSKQWPKIAFGEINFDSSKFLTDVMNDNTDTGSGAEDKKDGDWQEGLAGTGPGGAKNKSGAGKKPGAMADDIGPVGEEVSFSDGQESHRMWFDQKGSDATLMMASTAAPIDAQLQKWKKTCDAGLLLEADKKRALALIDEVKAKTSAMNSKADQVAAMKHATRKAKEVYEKNKGKKGNKVPKGKDGSRALNKQLTQEQRALRGKLTELAVLMVEVPFEPIQKDVKMHEGVESVGIVSDKTQAGVRVAKRKGTGKLEDVIAALGPPRTVSGTAREMFSAAAVKLEKLIEEVQKAKIRSGKINLRARKSLDKPARELEHLIQRLGERMRIPNLERARRFLRIPAAKLRKLEFKAHPKSPDGGVTYARRFIAEMKRQVKDQRDRLNKLSVDEWMHNLAAFSLNRQTYLALDAKGRAELLIKLEDRSARAKLRTETTLAQARKRIADLKAKRKKSKAEIEKLEAEEKKLRRALERQQAIETAQDEIQLVREGKLDAPRRAKVKPAYSDSDEAMDLRIIGRQHQERKARDDADEALLQKLIDEETAWKGLAKTASDLAILHRPDQVAGGYDAFEPLPPLPTGPQDKAGEARYLAALKKMFGPGDVNSDIGQQWKKQMTGAVADVKKAVPVKVAYPIHQLNFTMTVT